ncbi:MAG: hypothetical protein AAFR58_03015 [Cyanobacteria bacterium J06627_28]
MTPDQKLLYGQIARFKLDEPGVPWPFSVRLAWQYRWSSTFTHRAIREYKKFIFLIMVSEQPLSPATVIDRVWHHHILYTQSYWNDFCGQLLKRQIHHTPGRGIESDATSYYHQCAQALTLYQQYFGTPPPADIWSEPQYTVERPSYQWIDRVQYWLIPKPELSIGKLSSAIANIKK